MVAATKYSTISKEGAINPKSLDTPIAVGILSSDKRNNTYQKFILVGGTGCAILYMYVCVFFFS